MDYHTLNWPWSRKWGTWFSGSTGPSEERSGHIQKHSNTQVPKLAFSAIKINWTTSKSSLHLESDRISALECKEECTQLKSVLFDKFQGLKELAGGQNVLRSLHQKPRNHPGFFVPSSLVLHYHGQLIFTSCKVHHSSQSLPFTPSAPPTVVFPWTTVEETFNGCQGHPEWFSSPSWPGDAACHLQMLSRLSLMKLFQWVSPVYMRGASNFTHSHSTFTIYPVSVHLFYGLLDIFLQIHLRYMTTFILKETS